MKQPVKEPVRESVKQDTGFMTQIYVKQKPLEQAQLHTLSFSLHRDCQWHSISALPKVLRKLH